MDGQCLVFRFGFSLSGFLSQDTWCGRPRFCCQRNEMEIDKSLLPAESLGWRGLLTLMESSGVAAFIFSIWIVIVFDGWVCGWTNKGSVQ